MDTSSNKKLQSRSDLRELLRKDDKEAFVALYHEYWPELYRFAFNMLKDRDQSMDIVQDIYIWLWEHRKQLVIKTTLKGYLLAAVKFKAANVIRSCKVREDFFKQAAAIQSLPDSQGAAILSEAKELEDVIRQTIAAFPERCRTVYQLSRQEHLSNREIAGELGISVKTVENQMTIALKRLRIAVARLFISMCFLLPSLIF